MHLNRLRMLTSALTLLASMFCGCAGNVPSSSTSAPGPGSSNGGSGGGSGGGSTGTSKLVYLAQPTGTLPGVLIYPANATGSVTASASLDGPSGVTLGGIALDSSGRIYVVGNSQGTWTIAVYPAGATGAAAPIKTLTFTLPADHKFGNNISGLAVDAAGDIYVEDRIGFIWEFSNTDSGAASPLRSFQVSVIQFLLPPGEIAVDNAGFLYSASPYPGREDPSTGSVQVAGRFAAFAPSAPGVTPSTISYPVNNSYFFGAVADSSGTVYATHVSSAQGMMSIDKFGLDASNTLVLKGSINPADSPISGLSYKSIATDNTGSLFLLATNQSSGATYVAVVPAAGTGTTPLSNYFYPVDNKATTRIDGQYLAVY